MQVVPFEIIYPGTWLNLPDRQQSSEIENLLRQAEGSLFEAGLALGGFMAARGVRPEQHDLQSWEAKLSHRQEVEALVRRNLGMTEDDHGRRDEITLAVDRHILGEMFCRDEPPREYADRLPFVYAKSFLFTLDAFRKVLAQIITFQSAQQYGQQASDALANALPKLAGVRDSTAHADERTQGLARGKAIQTKPIRSPGISAPGGGLMIVSMLNGNNYGCTLADGELGEVPVTVDTFRSCVAILQGLLNALPWTGRPRLVPDPHR